MEKIFGKKFTPKQVVLIEKIIKWQGCVFVIAGAVLTAFNIYPANLIILNLGIIFYIAWSILVKEPSILVLNIVLFLIYLIGYLYS
tara:strand:+ start:274 stop:531 length:258 start_codon:yes stop_codon:yes gene_type:complete